MVLFYSCNLKMTWKYFNHITRKEFTSRQTAFTLTDNLFLLKLQGDCKFTKGISGVKSFKNTISINWLSSWHYHFKLWWNFKSCPNISKSNSEYLNKFLKFLWLIVYHRVDSYGLNAILTFCAYGYETCGLCAEPTQNLRLQQRSACQKILPGRISTCFIQSL